MGRRARSAARALAAAAGETRTRAIEGMARALRAQFDRVLAANAADLEDAGATGMAILTVAMSSGVAAINLPKVSWSLRK